MRIAIAGTGQLGASIMGPLVESGEHDVVALIQNGRAYQGYKRRLLRIREAYLPRNRSPIALARHHRIPMHWLDDMSEEALAPIRSLEPDLLITCGFGLILKKPLLDLPTIGCVNVHSSLLPKHRGPSPFLYVILSGEPESGVTFHITEEGIDTGDILDQAAFPVDSTDNALAIYYKACSLAGERVLGVVEKIEQSGLQGTPQPTEGASYDKKFKKSDLYIDWTLPATGIDRFIRALEPFMHARFRHDGHDVVLFRAEHRSHVVDADPGKIVDTHPIKVATGEGTLTITAAFTRHPVPFMWPLPWNPPQRGDTLA